MRLLAVNHHYVRDEAPARGIHPISYRMLRERIEAARQRFRPIGQGELLEALAAPAPGIDALVVTFDDGLREQAIAARRLADEAIPSICFVPTLPLVEKRLLEVHRIHLLRAAVTDAEIARDLSARHGAAFAAVDMDAARAQYRYDDDEARRVKFFLNFVFDAEERERWTAAAFARHCGAEREAAEALYMGEDEVRALAEQGMIGTHGHAHRPLATLPAAAQEADIARSLDVLRDLAGCEPAGIAYPYGGPDAVDGSTIAAAAALGLRYGFTMRRGINGPEAQAAPLALARIDTNDLVALLAQPEARA